MAESSPITSIALSLDSQYLLANLQVGRPAWAATQLSIGMS
jgi:hypothetical protein